MTFLKLVPDLSPEETITHTPDDDQETLSTALVAVRRAANCESLPAHTQSALRATVGLLERYVPKESR